MPSELPTAPAFEIMTQRANPYPDFCEKYKTATTGEGAARIAEVKYQVFKDVSKSGQDTPTFEKVAGFKTNMVCVERKGKFEDRKFPFLEIDRESENFILELTDRKH